MILQPTLSLQLRTSAGQKLYVKLLHNVLAGVAFTVSDHK